MIRKFLPLAQQVRKIDSFKRHNRIIGTTWLDVDIPDWWAAYYRVARGIKKMRVLFPKEFACVTFMTLDTTMVAGMVSGHLVHEPGVGLTFEFDMPETVRKTVTGKTVNLDWSKVRHELETKDLLDYRSTEAYKEYIEYRFNK